MNIVIKTILDVHAMRSSRTEELLKPAELRRPYVGEKLFEENVYEGLPLRVMEKCELKDSTLWAFWTVAMIHLQAYKKSVVRIRDSPSSYSSGGKKQISAAVCARCV